MEMNDEAQHSEAGFCPTYVQATANGTVPPHSPWREDRVHPSKQAMSSRTLSDWPCSTSRHGNVASQDLDPVETPSVLLNGSLM